MTDFVMSVRGRSGTGYNNRLGAAKFLSLPDGQQPQRSFEDPFTRWMAKVRAASGTTSEGCKGNVLFFVHGFNTEVFGLMERHRKIKDGLATAGYTGAVISFDWPSNGHVLGYVNDRLDARGAANHLMQYGIRPFAKAQEPDCDVNVHILAHSMGCFLVREAFDYAEDDHLSAHSSWTISQVALVAADISRKSMTNDASSSRSLVRRSTRISTYFNRHDQILSVSEIKRVGVSRRLGRVGAPPDRSEKVVNVDCSPFFDAHPEHHGRSESHRWYFEEPRFYEDLNAVLTANLDREVIPGREKVGDAMVLK